MLDAYRLHADRIHQIADSKYQQQQVDADGTVPDADIAIKAIME